jgi:hypothetical protein
MGRLISSLPKSPGRPGLWWQTQVRTPAYPLLLSGSASMTPTNARAGGIRLVEGKSRTEFDPYALFP